MRGFANLTGLVRNRVALGGVAIALITTIGVVLVVLASGGDDDKRAVAATPTLLPSPSPSPSPEPTLEPQPTPIPVIPGANSNDRLVIEKANVNAPINLKPVPANGGALPSPNGPDDVVFYDFAAFAGLGGYPDSGSRIVLSGHVDYGGGPCKNGSVPPLAPRSSGTSATSSPVTSSRCVSRTAFTATASPAPTTWARPTRRSGTRSGSPGVARPSR